MLKLNKFVNLFIVLLFLFACEEDDPLNFGDDRDAFLGKWNVVESCSKDAYSVNIVKDPSNSAQVLITNFWNTGNCNEAAYAIVAGESLFIPNQLFCDNAFKTDGGGDLNKEKITMSYNINDGADLFSCQATYSRP